MLSFVMDIIIINMINIILLEQPEHLDATPGNLVIYN